MNVPETRSSSLAVVGAGISGLNGLWNHTAKIGLCGDWCLGARVEAAYDSGVALARAVLEPS
jgi:hypothetical protein